MNTPARRVALSSFVVLAVFALAAASPIAAQPTDLIISEYIEGSASNKAIEFFNGTAAAIDLGTGSYRLETYSNGSATVSSFVALTGTVAAGATYVIAPTDASQTLRDLADQVTGSGWFNGDDALVLRKGGSGGTVLDSFGQVGTDPGASWGTGILATVNHTLRRKSSVCAGDTTIGNAFDPAVEWDGFDQDTFSGLRSHSVSCSAVDTAPSIVSTNPTAGATDVAVASNITVTFTEAVTVDATSFTLACPSGTPFAGGFVVSGSGTTTITINPAGDLPAGTSCAVGVVAAAVIDLDGTADPMASDYAWTFTTATPPATISLIHEIQGSGLLSPLVGQVVTIEGIVTGVFQGAAPALGGFFVQEESGDVDADPLTSEGICVYSDLVAVLVGDKVRVTGTVVEFHSTASGLSSDLTELGSVTSIVKDGTGAVPAATPISFPVNAVSDLERYEGMLVTFPQTLTVTDNYDLGRYGQIVLSNGRLPVGTHVTTPGAAAVAQEGLNLRNAIVLDDTSTGQNLDPIGYPAPGLSASNTLRSGYTVAGLAGVLYDRYGLYMVEPTGGLAGVAFTPAANPRPAAPAAVGGNLKVAAFNVNNFFTTLDTGPDICGPLGTGSCRGANDATELTRQTAKLVNTIVAINADIAGLLEIENDLTNNTIQHLVDQVNLVAGANTYGFIATGPIGTDSIRAAIIYKPAVVAPVGAHATLGVVPFDYGNRPPLAQTFQLNSSAARFTLVVNHLRSKGSCPPTDPNDPKYDPPNNDQGDGQGCWNVSRAQAAALINTWLAGDPTASGDPDFLLVGDMNAYRYEDPITTFVNAGYTDLIQSFVGPAAYSYSFDAEWGYLDHALGSPSLAAQVTGVTEWHMNADEPVVLDYNLEFKSVGQQVSLYSTLPFRISDHDPLIVGLNLAVNAAPTVEAGGPYSVTVGFTTTLTAVANDPNGDALTVEWDLDNNGTYETVGNPVTFSAVALLPGAYTVGVRATETASEGLFATDTATVTVIAGPAITSPASTFFVAGTGGTFSITTTGFPVPTLTLAGTLPAGLTFIDNGDGTATISGTAAPGSEGSYTVTVTASNGVGTPFVQTLTILVTAVAGAAIPVLDGVGLGLLAALVALGGVFLVGRRLS